MNDPCDPCKPRPGGSGEIDIATSSAIGWNVCVAGDIFAVYSWGSYSLPGLPITSEPDFPLPVPWVPTPATADPAVKYNITPGFQQDVPVTVNGIYVGSITGGSNTTVYEGSDPALSPYPPICPNGGVVLLDSQSYPPPIDPVYYEAWLWVQQVCHYKEYHTYIYLAGGSYVLNPAYTDLYQTYKVTDPLILPGGPRLPITVNTVKP